MIPEFGLIITALVVGTKRDAQRWLNTRITGTATTIHEGKEILKTQIECTVRLVITMLFLIAP